MRRSTVLLVSALVLAGATVNEVSAQHKPRSSDAIAGDYNKSAQTIQDEIDALRKKLENTNLSMTEAASLVDFSFRLPLRNAEEV